MLHEFLPRLPKSVGRAVVATTACVIAALYGSPALAQEDRFDVWEIRVGGNTVLEARAIESIVYPYLGPAKSIEDVEVVRGELEALYREKGYSAAIVSIPEQTVQGGIVRLEVTEGRLGRVTVSGARYVSGRDIISDVDGVRPGDPVYFPDLQDDLVALNRMSADRSVTPVLRPGRSIGQVDLDLRVNDGLPIHGSFAVNDQFTADTTETRATAVLSYDNLFQRFHSLSMQYTVAPEAPEETEIFAATYLWRFRDTPNLAAFYAVDTNSDVATVGNLNVLGTGQIFGARYIIPLNGEGGFVHSVTLGADYKDFTETIGNARSDEGNENGDEEEDLFTPISYTNLSANYTFGWNAENYQSTYSFAANFGVRGFGNDPGEFTDKRFKADPNYFYLRASVENLLRLPLGGIGFYTRFAGQYSPGPLVANEQFTAGGATTVRGYLEAERLGDYGALGNVEIRTPNLGPMLPARPNNVFLFAFFDAATLGSHEVLPGQDPHFDLYSTGLGLRFDTEGGLSAALDYAWPMIDSVNVQAWDERFHFLVQYGF